MADGGAPYNVMVVDDSAVIRGLITKAIETDSQLHVVASVGDGQHAVTMLQKMTEVEVVVLDIEMPVMDGIAAIPKLLAVNPHIKIIMSSTLTLRNAEISLQALELGASDYIPKPTSTKEMTGVDNFNRELVDKVKTLGALARRAMQHGGSVLQSGRSEAPAAVTVRPKEPPVKATSASATIPYSAASHKDAPAIRPTEAAAPVQVPVSTPKVPSLHLNEGPIELRHTPIMTPDIIAIGSSTGGPQALFEVLKSLKGLSQPIVLTQHMPATFTTILAQHITNQCGLPAKEAEDGEKLQPGLLYVAPGDYHMLITGQPGEARVVLNQNPPENFCRPAVDPMLRSLAAVYGRRVLVVILTGMGADGARGAQTVVDAGGTVVAQDEATSVVWGMPAATAKLGLCHAVLPLNDIGPWLRAAAMGQKTKG